MRDINLAYDFIEEYIPELFSQALKDDSNETSKLIHEVVSKLINEDRDMLFEWADEKAREYDNSDKGKEAAAALERARERYRNAKP